MALQADEIDELDAAELAAGRVRKNWVMRARNRPLSKGKQLPPTDLEWTILLFRAGRGFGKTEALSQWFWWDLWKYPGLIGHAVAPTHSDLRTVLFEGPVGICSLIPAECLKYGSLERAYNKTAHELLLANGSKVLGFSATQDGTRMRGPQCHLMVGDEIAAWDQPKGNLEKAMSNALFGLRLPYPDGAPARALLGTTPRPIPFLKRFEKRRGVRVITGSSYENLPNLSRTYRDQLFALAGTTLGRQEIDAAYIDEEAPTSIFRRSWIKLWPASKPLPEFSFILESYDTATSETDWNEKEQKNDPTACVILGVFNVAKYFTEDERRKMGCRSRYAALLLNCWAEHLGFPDLLERARAQHKVRYGPMRKRSDLVLIEDKSSGAPLRQSLAKYSVPTWPFNPGRMDKTQRGHASAPVVKQGMLFVPESARPERAGLPRDWVEPFLEEVCAYSGPGSTEHDDQYDALTGALIYLKSIGTLEISVDPETIDREEKILKDREEAEHIAAEERFKVRVNPYAA